MGDHIQEAMEFLGYAREILPVWFQISAFVLIGMCVVAFCYAVYRMFINPLPNKSDKQQEMMNTDEREICRYCRCGDIWRDDVRYSTWQDFHNDCILAGEFQICLEHVLRRGRLGLPKKPPTTDEMIDTRIREEQRRILERKLGSLEKSTATPCPPCRRLV